MSIKSKPIPKRDAICGYLEAHGSATGPQIAGHLGITRQAVGPHLRQLIDEGTIFKSGSTRGARYFPGGAAPPPRSFSKDLPLAGLDEAVIYEQVAITLGLSGLSSNVEAIVNYAFTEILNNAIDHSMTDRCSVKARLDATKLSFSVRDSGIGVFHSIEQKFSLPDEQAAMIELVKGKTTTKPEVHSGEGLFFVSRSADRFVLRSHRLQVEWDRDRDDVFVSDPHFIKGTLVRFELRRDTRTRLDDVFGEFAPEAYDFQFQRTRILVKLLRSDYVSRSEAKRLLLNLDKFSEIELDMRDVRNLGQGFADQVFRVFATSHPGILIKAIKTSPAVKAMIRHAGGTSG